MRKIEEQMVSAMRNKRTMTRDNTEVCIDGETIIVKLHGNQICKIEDGIMLISDCGWFTKTTKSRLNAILWYYLPAMGTIYSDRKERFIRYDGRVFRWTGSLSFSIQ